MLSRMVRETVCKKKKSRQYCKEKKGFLMEKQQVHRLGEGASVFRVKEQQGDQSCYSAGRMSMQTTQGCLWKFFLQVRCWYGQGVGGGCSEKCLDIHRRGAGRICL